MEILLKKIQVQGSRPQQPQKPLTVYGYKEP